MNYEKYVNIFRQAADQIDKKLLIEKELEVAISVVLDSVCLKLYKKNWTNGEGNPLTAEARIFFSVWISESTLQSQKLLYNIHAFKLRNLKSYKIESRKFASVFRISFEPYEQNWQNVKTNFGPLTLMEGWLPVNDKELQHDVLKLANNFLKIDHLIDQSLSEFKK